MKSGTSYEPIHVGTAWSTVETHRCRLLIVVKVVSEWCDCLVSLVRGNGSRTGENEKKMGVAVAGAQARDVGRPFSMCGTCVLVCQAHHGVGRFNCTRSG